MSVAHVYLFGFAVGLISGAFLVGLVWFGMTGPRRGRHHGDD